jgi:AmmeMemoRadiSam system protein A
MDGRLDDSQRSYLLGLARRAILSRLEGAPLPHPERPPAALAEPGAAFVTLTEPGHRLRGCIGHVIGHDPLWRSVRDNALAAAFEDPRFPPVSRDEIDRLEIEISVLSPLVRAERPDAVEVGRHGVVLSGDGRRGLLLPQVPLEYGWDRETFLAHACRKAGLPPDSWRRPGTRIELFTAEVFSERDLLR